MKNVHTDHVLPVHRKPKAPPPGIEPPGQAVGHLHDPLAYLARQVRLLLDMRCRTIWCDGRGRIFVVDSDRFQAPSAHSIIGRYDARTRIETIETDLRSALRERASRWIVDWNATAK